MTFDSLPAIISPAGTIEAIRPDGRGRHTILAATDTLGAHKPWFSPDGSRLLFTGIVNLTNTPAPTVENWAQLGTRVKRPPARLNQRAQRRTPAA